MQNYTKKFNELDKTKADIAGGKGASLGEMLNAGIPVPDGFVVLSTTFENFLHKADLIQEIDAILESVDHKAVHSIDGASEKIQELIKHAEMPSDIASEIEEQFKTLDSEFVAVRSSATAEDGADHAWAGQLDSYLNTTKDTLLEKVQHCWASLFTPRAIFYRFEKGLNTTKISVAVVVQKMVNSEKSGIAFSVHPVTEDRNQIIIEAGFGLGEAIVSGSVTPDSYVVEKEPRKIIDINVSNQTRAMYRKVGGGNEWQELGDKGGTQVFSEPDILALSEIIMTIENHYGFPCDIEWAFENGKFYIVQSRPITTLSQKEVENNIVSELNLIDTSWIRKSAEGYFHLTFPFIQASTLAPTAKKYPSHHAILNLVQNDIITVYLNADVLRKTREEFFNIVRKDPEYLEKIKKEYYEAIDSYEEVLNNLNQVEFENISDNELGLLYENFFKEYVNVFKYFCTLGEAISHQAIEYMNPIFEKKLGESFQEIFPIITHPSKPSFIEEEALDRNVLVQEFKQKGSIDTELETKIKTHAEKYFYLSNNYLRGAKLDTDWFVDQISKTDIISARDDSVSEKKKEYIKNIGFSDEELFLLKIVDECFKLIDDRKKNMMKASYYQLKFLYELEKRTKIPLMLLKWSVQPEYRTLLDKTFPESILLERSQGSVSIINDDSSFTVISGDSYKKISEYFSKQFEIKQEDKSIIKGISASAGKFIGKVKILLRIEDIDKVKDGDVLVASMTRPEMIPAMKVAGAFVTNEGGITCHAAIVARELNKPCVIGTKFATEILKDGDEVEVDADNGIVKIISSKSNVLLAQKFIDDLSGEKSIPPLNNYSLFVFGSGYNTAKYFKNVFKKEVDYTLLNVRHDGNTQTFLSEYAWKQYASEVFENYLKNTDYIKEIEENFYKNFPAIDELYKKYTYKFIESQNEETLLPTIEQSFNLFWTTNAWSHFSIYFDIDLCYTIIEKVSPNTSKSEIEEIWHNATDMVAESFDKAQKRDILGYIKNNPALDIDDLAEYCQYFFTSYKNVPALTKIKEEITKVYGSFIEKPETVIHELEEMDSELKQKQNQFDSWKNGLSDLQKKVVDFCQIVMRVRDQRKNHFAKGIVVAWRVAEKVFVEAKVDKNLIENILPFEELMQGSKFVSSISDELSKRNDGYAVYVPYNGAKQVSYEKIKENYDLVNSYFIGDHQKQSEEIRGQIGNKGLVQGYVKIVRSVNEFDKFKDGEILVTGMTRPEFVSLMRVAKAIITDEGGITCHAAIVSRELNKPCVIGTKFATKILKDGDFVEVDANNGVIRIIK